jgi:hypothetical protein
VVAPRSVVIEGENLLDALCPAAALVGQHLKHLPDLRQPRIVSNAGGTGAPADAIEYHRQVEWLRTGL